MKNKTADTDESRRRFLVKLSLSLGALAGAAISIPVVSALLAPFFKKDNPVWRNIGAAETFSIGSTTLVKFVNADPMRWAGVTANSAAWLRRKGESEFIAFSVNCTHLGCPVRWEEGAQLFMCPCHGGVYYKDGSKASGPPPKALTRYKVRVVNGQVQIKTAPVAITGIGA